MKLEIIYDPLSGFHCPDGLCEAKAKEIVKNGGTVTIGSSLLFDYIRLEVKNGAISAEDVRVIFQGQHPAMYPDGRLSNWPRGFCDYFERVLDALLD
jgi:hypothetical protein